MIDAITAKLFLFPMKFFIVKAQPINIIATKNKGCESSEWNLTSYLSTENPAVLNCSNMRFKVPNGNTWWIADPFTYLFLC